MPSGANFGSSPSASNFNAAPRYAKKATDLL
jgi:hypothetical protein